MALISSHTIVMGVSLFHLAMAYFLLSNPTVLSDQNLVYIIGEGMGMPEARGFDNRSSPLGFIAVVLGMLALGDLVSLSMPEEITLLYYWGTQAPFRFAFSMAVSLYAFLAGPASPWKVSIFAPTSARRVLAAEHSQRQGLHLSKTGWGGDALVNRVVFTFLFLEMIFWFWLWLTIREERPAIIEKARKDMAHEHRE